MTPSKKGTTTSIRIEKVRKAQIDRSQVQHQAGGQHSGLTINKQAATGDQLAAGKRLCFLLWLSLSSEMMYLFLLGWFLHFFVV